MTLPWLVSTLLFLVVGGVLFLWLWYDRRSVKPYESARNQALFICVRCGHLYPAPRGKDLSPCPQCGYDNLKLHF